MQTIDDIKQAARTKLVGYTDKEIECFVQGAMYMVGNLPQRRSEEWYQQQADKKVQAAMDLYCDYIKSRYGILQTEQELDMERRYELQRNLRNGHIIKVVESRIFTDIKQFKRMILE